jgi:hypothetical protein
MTDAKYTARFTTPLFDLTLKTCSTVIGYRVLLSK